MRLRKHLISVWNIYSVWVCLWWAMRDSAKTGFRVASWELEGTWGCAGHSPDVCIEVKVLMILLQQKRKNQQWTERSLSLGPVGYASSLERASPSHLQASPAAIHVSSDHAAVLYVISEFMLLLLHISSWEHEFGRGVVLYIRLCSVTPEWGSLKHQRSFFKCNSVAQVGNHKF